MSLSTEQRAVASLLQRSENRRCADCGALGPTWASINLGVFMCMDCSGIHRAMGTHISKVKSTTLDSWKSEWVQHMASIGNVKANATWEATLPDSQKLRPNAPSSEREQFVRSKYQRRVWKGTPTSETVAKASKNLQSPKATTSLESLDNSMNPAVARRLARMRLNRDENANDILSPQSQSSPSLPDSSPLEIRSVSPSKSPQTHQLGAYQTNDLLDLDSPATNSGGDTSLKTSFDFLSGNNQPVVNNTQVASPVVDLPDVSTNPSGFCFMQSKASAVSAPATPSPPTTSFDFLSASPKQVTKKQSGTASTTNLSNLRKVSNGDIFADLLGDSSLPVTNTRPSSEPRQRSSARTLQTSPLRHTRTDISSSYVLEDEKLNNLVDQIISLAAPELLAANVPFSERVKAVSTANAALRANIARLESIFQQRIN